jgi:hypothetical protein
LRLDLSFFKRSEFLRNPIVVKERREENVLGGFLRRRIHRDVFGHLHDERTVPVKGGRK